MHHTFLYISLPSLHDYDAKWPNCMFFFFEDGKGMAINSTISVWTRAQRPLLSSNINFLLFSNWATWDNREMVCRMRSLFFQRPFNGRCRCRIVFRISYSPLTNFWLQTMLCLLLLDIMWPRCKQRKLAILTKKLVQTSYVTYQSKNLEFHRSSYYSLCHCIPVHIYRAQPLYTHRDQNNC